MVSRPPPPPPESLQALEQLAQFYRARAEHFAWRARMWGLLCCYCCVVLGWLLRDAVLTVWGV